MKNPTNQEPADLVEMLQTKASQHPEKIALTFLVDGELEEVHLTYAQLDLRARQIAASLQASHAPGERTLLLYPPGLEFIEAYFGCLYAGIVAVPAYPPRLNRPAPRIQAIVADAQASSALTTPAILEDLERRFDHTPDLQALHWVDTLAIAEGSESAWYKPTINQSTLAFIQYTSGSTSVPKGVMITHGNLMANLYQIKQGFLLESEDIGVCWLPSYHDMGLIGGILESLYSSIYSVLLAPFAFLQRPVRWLQAISRYKGTICGGPNFAYDLCVQKTKPEVIETLDLSSWRLAFSGAEPVRMDTMRKFSETFAPCGFHLKAFYPCYGLAEATLFVTGGNGPGKPETMSLQRSALEQRLVEPVAPGDSSSLTLVNCGSPKGDVKLAIADPETMQAYGDDEIGEIWISGSSVAQGYWERSEETERTFQARLADTGEGPYFRSGDLGFLHQGDLYVTGRIKDLIIIRGSNHYPQDIELTVEQSHEALYPGSGAAFSIDVKDDEQLVVCQEVSREHRNANLDEVIRAIRRAVAENHDLQVYAVVLLRPLTIPKTSSGKIQRHACKAAFLNSSLDVVMEWRMHSSE